ncbi:MAG: 2-C-methyl-D-erythritol 2,4-cyclodiphosphate synthase [Deltaproteobacteria bacterium]|nr:MAG: 2-C-methyl-D-erythritol 2,4-cyclodiphosphate synthase [Deltaproteobacteria bacterium]
MRVGLGYDIHPLVPGRKFLLGGVEIPFEKGPQGHSDGDALLHAVTDALLGAAALGDIGSYFSDTDPQWKNADSKLFVEETLKIISHHGWKIQNVDANILLEKPKLAPYKEEIRKSLADVLKILVDQVNIKGKRGEGLDAVGHGEAIVVQVAILISK